MGAQFTIRLRMRSYSLLILLIGAAASEPIFRSGKEYVYDYQGKLLSGIPELDTHFAGLMIEGKIILQTLDTETFSVQSLQNDFAFNHETSKVGVQLWDTRQQFTLVVIHIFFARAKDGFRSRSSDKEDKQRVTSHPEPNCELSSPCTLR